jgi:type II secretory pathway pseudopilin PulG
MEMLVVVAIIVALAGIGGFFLMRALSDSQKDLAQAQARTTLTDACRAYAIKHNGQFPESLQQLLQQDARGGPYLEDADALKDPWGQNFQYDRSGPKNQGKKPDIWTTTPEGLQVGNWPMNQ